MFIAAGRVPQSASIWSCASPVRGASFYVRVERRWREDLLGWRPKIDHDGLPRLFICCECKFAVVMAEVVTDLRHERHRLMLTPAQRRAIWSSMQQVAGVIQDQTELQRFQYPPPTTGPIPFIQAPMEDGMGCKQCGAVTGRSMAYRPLPQSTWLGQPLE